VVCVFEFRRERWGLSECCKIVMNGTCHHHRGDTAAWAGVSVRGCGGTGQGRGYPFFVIIAFNGRRQRLTTSPSLAMVFSGSCRCRHVVTMLWALQHADIRMIR
jgi:hypothetical protein